jgi:hypothetical protein
MLRSDLHSTIACRAVPPLPGASVLRDCSHPVRVIFAYQPGFCHVARPRKDGPKGIALRYPRTEGTQPRLTKRRSMDREPTVQKPVFPPNLMLSPIIPHNGSIKSSALWRGGVPMMCVSGLPHRQPQAGHSTPGPTGLHSFSR